MKMPEIVGGILAVHAGGLNEAILGRQIDPKPAPGPLSSNRSH